MQFFVDTAHIDEIKEIAELGQLDGVTTNPSLVAQTGRDYESVIREICEICSGPISAEVLAIDYEGMMAEARKWHKVAEQIVVKVPLTLAGLKAVNQCHREGIRTNVTLCFSATQALAAAKAGATYISPFVGRLDDIGLDGMDLIREIKAIYSHYALSTQILVASIRSPNHITQAAMIGAECATIPPKVFKQIIQHPLTDKGLAQFLEDAKKIPSR